MDLKIVPLLLVIFVVVGNVPFRININYQLSDKTELIQNCTLMLH